MIFIAFIKNQPITSRRKYGTESVESSRHLDTMRRFEMRSFLFHKKEAVNYLHK